MEVNEELTWKQRYDRMKAHYGWTDAVIAEHIGNTASAVRQVVNREELPRWLRLAIIIYEMENGLCDKAVFL